VDEYLIERQYHCKVCNTTHTIQLDKKIAEGRKKYPFPYIALHDTIVNGSEVKEVLAILYIDKGLQIRHAEIQEFGEGNIFSKEQVMAMTNPFMEEISILREELAKKEEKIDELKKRLKPVQISENEVEQDENLKNASKRIRKCPICGKPIIFFHKCKEGDA